MAHCFLDFGSSIRHMFLKIEMHKYSNSSTEVQLDFCESYHIFDLLLPVYVEILSYMNMIFRCLSSPAHVVSALLHAALSSRISAQTCYEKVKRLWRPFSEHEKARWQRKLRLFRAIKITGNHFCSSVHQQ